MTLAIEDDHDGQPLAITAKTQGSAVRVTVSMIGDEESVYGTYFGLHASGDGSFVELPETVAQKDNVTCLHQVHSLNDDTLTKTGDSVEFTWTPTSGNLDAPVTISMLFGNGPGDDVA